MPKVSCIPLLKAQSPGEVSCQNGIICTSGMDGNLLGLSLILFSYSKQAKVSEEICRRDTFQLLD